MMDTVSDNKNSSTALQNQRILLSMSGKTVKYKADEDRTWNRGSNTFNDASFVSWTCESLDVVSLHMTWSDQGENGEKS